MTEPTEIELALGEQEALDLVAEAAEAFSAEWSRHGRGGPLTLPALAGLRRGWIQGHLDSQKLTSGGSRLVFTVEEEHLFVHRPSFAVLLISALGALVVCLWPFVPSLLPLAPVGAVFAVVGWLLVASRVRHQGVKEFFDLLAGMADSAPSPD